MVRKYNPEMKPSDSYWTTGNPYDDYDATMVESRDGKWVKLQVFKDEQAQLQSQIAKLKKQIKKLEEKNQQPVEDYPQNYT